ncbi:50S ribosomal protein L31 [Candidatus Daviesbacteria bacterium RIFCSPLOWO2_02_FULL_40_8]|uniref:Large ribosomal subunit protein bL31 n=1 Tax=Candidatus Daviesbacteria bacterium RIFCSPLOWO2_01_FULL_40_24 TaxID=1797787 RepID=A0A1F5MK74_9BACT|nr:MAG: 50S ribosomal protein L31 [Candidatus Daviesbacteria bacterium RIFCSPHIGHO2_01_FULL_41_45]OGE35041.1 MAG: 50S ribosomal protein L31 [Candidatus Daviesbacteria bacterium RIFCSPHIGHO2_02_FULL_41_14]OGE65748.1 MAG: 50S ribosomal protein L31 [Candidatus Daviesbacteria bacterium RIFCSPLOWO2_01_FULL_40_24]OGE67070.1 MAG: 50S ribosomal protein L31 [Candidatus Daviesbacteria bacterium RIFCSPLOWO2_02_FULL_40_8]
MKQVIHPTWYPDAKISCVCGNNFSAGSTLPEIRVEICALCHPFYTGTQKLVDTQGQVDRFVKAQERAAKIKVERVKIVEARAAKVQKTNSDKPSLKDLLLQARKQVSS